ncbi:hypothetical protein jhhlp_001435 [Lomentospora prolificans]|uniref:Uncharacterized protein n=1 Tax=Lomentospora prolificans TaxID=41688 RepID=A0A2N3NI68_9PEZI|nr:hypothetical protein jhhlp_001435 [Lomentospora prolificans]
MAPTYIISRTMDPIFALFIGVGAAVTRIRREEMEKGRTNREIVDLALRTLQINSMVPPTQLIDADSGPNPASLFKQFGHNFI